MKNLVFLSTAIFLFFSASGQVIKVDSTTHWKKYIKVGLNINQASFSSNWTAGGTNSIGAVAVVHWVTKYKKDKTSWDNDVDLGYGYVNNEGQGFRKTLDRFYLDTKFGHELSKKWSTYASLNFLSQFSKGFKYEDDVNGVEQELLISDIMAPAFITASFGFEYHPVEYFKVRISPLSPRATIVNDAQRFVTTVGSMPYGVDPNDNGRFEWYAFQLTADFKKDIAKNLNLKFRYLLFANYETFEAKTIDQRLELKLSAKVNNFIDVNLGGVLLYDIDQDSGLQYNQFFTLGFVYSFQNYEDKK
ncbi:MAG: DUF3078 domain-containing protein [Flammeovirgaceae bacterium]|nr:DUF3078 domain-containing protein [Flammeovirgaceae bacterium]